MSRLIVKNLPKDIKEGRLRSLFSTKGEITDLRLCKTKDGKFRRFGFVGFKTNEEADAAFKYFNNSFIDTSKIQIELARNLGDKSVARPWSKYSEGSSAYEKLHKDEKPSNSSTNDGNSDESKSGGKRENKNSASDGVNELEDDPEFQEFLQAHESRTTKSLSGNDIITTPKKKKKEKEDSTKKEKCKVKRPEKPKELSSNDKESGGDASSSDQSDGDFEDQTETSKNASNISDMDYLKSKIVSNNESNADKASEKKKSSKTKKDKNEPRDNGKKLSKSKIDENDSSDEQSENKDTKQTDTLKHDSKPWQTNWTLKMRGLPFKVKDKHIIEFFSPIKCVNIRLVTNKKGQPSGRAFVDFKSHEDLENAMKRDKDYLEGRYIELFKDESRHREMREGKEEEEKPWVKKMKESKNDYEEDESIGESGRLFLRNLAYACTEDDIQKLFEPYGPLSEVNLPLDKVTSKTIGIGYVTFLMPEHAVKAFNGLDGSVFQGRMLHILPSKAKKTEDENAGTGESSYKKKNEAKKKSQSGSDHNWNTLFLGVNAVADVMADKYNTTKRGILDAESSNSLAVRMALGETQVVADTRKFLVDNGVKLDVFGQPASKRSKTVIIAKNLPYETSTGELRTMFNPFGQLQRVILPPTGITALIEFQEPSMARKAFQKLAYTKFKNTLMYLEWAPTDVFTEGTPKQDTEQQQEKDETNTNEDENMSEDSETEEEESKTLFVKNLNFDTVEDTIKERFSQVGKVKCVTIARKKDSKNQGALLSMGYGFVEFKKKSSALKALKELQYCMVDDHALELKISHRKTNEQTNKRQASASKQKSSKILVRNVPFEATSKELKELFSTFGEIKTLRLPKKMAGTGPHRGFAFVDFLTKQDAKRAFEALSTSTHLYGRRLVLEWAEEEEDIDSLRKRTAKHYQEEPRKAKKKKELLNELMDLTEES